MIAGPDVDREAIRVADYFWSAQALGTQAATLTARVVKALASGRIVELSFAGVSALDPVVLGAIFEGLHNRFNVAWLERHVFVRDAAGDLSLAIETARTAVLSRSRSGYRPAV